MTTASKAPMKSTRRSSFSEGKRSELKSEIHASCQKLDVEMANLRMDISKRDDQRCSSNPDENKVLKMSSQDTLSDMEKRVKDAYSNRNIKPEEAASGEQLLNEIINLNKKLAELKKEEKQDAQYARTKRVNATPVKEVAPVVSGRLIKRSSSAVNARQDDEDKETGPTQSRVEYVKYYDDIPDTGSDDHVISSVDGPIPINSVQFVSSTIVEPRVISDGNVMFYSNAGVPGESGVIPSPSRSGKSSPSRSLRNSTAGTLPPVPLDVVTTTTATQSDLALVDTVANIYDDIPDVDEEIQERPSHYSVRLVDEPIFRHSPPIGTPDRPFRYSSIRHPLADKTLECSRMFDGELLNDMMETNDANLGAYLSARPVLLFEDAINEKLDSVMGQQNSFVIHGPKSTGVSTLLHMMMCRKIFASKKADSYVFWFDWRKLTRADTSSELLVDVLCVITNTLDTDLSNRYYDWICSVIDTLNEYQATVSQTYSGNVGGDVNLKPILAALNKSCPSSSSTVLESMADAIVINNTPTQCIPALLTDAIAVCCSNVAYCVVHDHFDEAHVKVDKAYKHVTRIISNMFMSKTRTPLLIGVHDIGLLQLVCPRISTPSQACIINTVGLLNPYSLLDDVAFLPDSLPLILRTDADRVHTVVGDCGGSPALLASYLSLQAISVLLARVCMGFGPGSNETAAIGTDFSYGQLGANKIADDVSRVSTIIYSISKAYHIDDEQVEDLTSEVMATRATTLFETLLGIGRPEPYIDFWKMKDSLNAVHNRVCKSRRR